MTWRRGLLLLGVVVITLGCASEKPDVVDLDSVCPGQRRAIAEARATGLRVRVVNAQGLVLAQDPPTSQGAGGDITNVHVTITCDSPPAVIPPVVVTQGRRR